MLVTRLDRGATSEVWSGRGLWDRSSLVSAEGADEGGFSRTVMNEEHKIKHLKGVDKIHWSLLPTYGVLRV